MTQVSHPKTGNKQPSFFGNFLRWFLVFYILFFALQYFFGDPKESVSDSNLSADIVIQPERDEYVMGNVVRFFIENTSDKTYVFNTPCGAENENVKFSFVTTHSEAIDYTDISRSMRDQCRESEIGDVTLNPQQSIVFQTKEYNANLFSEAGTYQLEMTWEDEEGNPLIVQSEVGIEKAGWFRTLFRSIVTRPLFNILVFLTEYVPGNSYGVAIIILTILVRLILFVPNQKAMKSQRELQKIQPELLRIKEQHKGNQQMIALKTMELYKSHNINPLGGLLPILLQMPFLLGIFYLLQDGLSPHLRYLLYSFYNNADFSIGDVFFVGLNLGGGYEVNALAQVILALVVAGVQFVAVRLSMARAQTKDKPVEKKNPEDPMYMMQNAGKIMMWVMPFLVALFSISLPAGVGLYWCVSTLFGIGQQWFVNKQLEKPQIRKKTS